MQILCQFLSPVWEIKKICWNNLSALNRRLAQLVERCPYKADVVGSIPAPPTMKIFLIFCFMTGSGIAGAECQKSALVKQYQNLLSVLQKYQTNTQQAQLLHTISSTIPLCHTTSFYILQAGFIRSIAKEITLADPVTQAVYYCDAEIITPALQWLKDLKPYYNGSLIHWPANEEILKLIQTMMDSMLSCYHDNFKKAHEEFIFQRIKEEVLM